MALEKRMGHGEEYEFATDGGPFRAILVMELNDGGRFRAYNGETELPRTGDRYALRELNGPAAIEVRPDNEVFGNRAELYVRVQARDTADGLVDLALPPFKVAARDTFTPLTLLPTATGVRVIGGDGGGVGAVRPHVGDTGGSSVSTVSSASSVNSGSSVAPVAGATDTSDAAAPTVGSTPTVPAGGAITDVVHIIVDSSASMLRSTTVEQMDAMLSFAVNAVSVMRCAKHLTTSSGQTVPGIVDTLEVPAGTTEALRGNDIGWEINATDISPTAAVIAISDDVPARLLGRSAPVHVISPRPVATSAGITATLFDDRLHRAVAEGDARSYRDAIHSLRGAIDAGVTS